MRIRRMLAVSVLASGLVMVAPGVAHASGGKLEVAECLAKAGEKYKAGEISASKFDEDAKQCYSAPSPLVPEVGEIIWGGLAFLIVAFGLIKFG